MGTLVMMTYRKIGPFGIQIPAPQQKLILESPKLGTQSFSNTF